MKTAIKVAMKRSPSTGIVVAGLLAICSGCASRVLETPSIQKLRRVQKELAREEGRLLRIRSEILRQRLKLTHIRHAAEIAQWRGKMAKWRARASDWKVKAAKWRAKAAKWKVERDRLQSQTDLIVGKPVKKEKGCEPRPGYGFLRINTKPWTKVYVDGRYVGLTPEVALRLEAGPHTLRLTNPKYGIHRTYRITIDACSSKTFVKSLAQKGWGHGTLRINTKPWTRIYVDGRYMGMTPEVNIRLEAGTHTLMLSNPEYGISETYTISIVGGTSKTFVKKLTR